MEKKVADVSVCLSKQFMFPCHQCEETTVDQLIASEPSVYDDYECLLAERCPLKPCTRSEAASGRYMLLAGTWLTKQGYKGPREVSVRRGKCPVLTEARRHADKVVIDAPPPLTFVLEPTCVGGPSSGPTLVCPYCGVSCTSVGAGRQHIRAHHQKHISYKCCIENCDKVVTDYGRYLSHVANTHRACYKSPLFPCSLCGTMFTRERYLKSHTIRQHEGGRCRVTCPHCETQVIKTLSPATSAITSPRHHGPTPADTRGVRETLPNNICL